jgi:hypothetical protein
MRHGVIATYLEIPVRTFKPGRTEPMFVHGDAKKVKAGISPT